MEGSDQPHAGEEWAVVTGAGSGIGAALCRALANDGLHVLAVSRTGSSLDALRQSCPNPSLIHPCRADIRRPEAWSDIVGALRAREGANVRYLVHDAAVGEPERVGHISLEQFQDAMETNVTAPLFLSQELLPLLERSQPPGRILHVGAGIAHRPQVGSLTYGVTKAAFHRLYEQLRLELPTMGKVRIASVRPGTVDTPGLTKLIETPATQLPDVEYLRGMRDRGELYTADEAAEFIRFVLKDVQDDDEYSREEWNIRDSWHHSRWKKDTTGNG